MGGGGGGGGEKYIYHYKWSQNMQSSPNLRASDQYWPNKQKKNNEM